MRAIISMYVYCSFVAHVLLLLLTSPSCSDAFPLRKPFQRLQHHAHLHESVTDDFFFASTEAVEVVEEKEKAPFLDVAPNGVHSHQQRRELGSQELLMLPRQYGPNKNADFPQMNHVSVVTLSSTPDIDVLKKAIDEAAKVHPLLQARVEGDGEPDERIDLFQMVRKGEPSPLTFVSETGIFTAEDLLTVVDTNDLEQSWKAAFARDLDDGSWCNTKTGPLWKVELHRSKMEDACALLLSFNHAVSDQSSANRLTDQILRNLAEIEEKGETSPAVNQDIPIALEDSVMGLDQRWNEVKLDGVSIDTAKYVAGKAAEGLKSPVILPDTVQGADNDNSLSALTILSGRAAGGADCESSKRKSVVEFRSLSKAKTSALLNKCREKGVSVSNALTAAATLTVADFVGSTKKKRHYKILQSLDMRRYGEQLDKGETVACMAGSHDLMHGPFQDGAGKALRMNPSAQRLDMFWNLATEGKKQTEEFVNSGGPYQAVRVFDFAMSISDLNNLVHLTAQSKETKGRAYSAGVTNVGVYEKQTGFQREDEAERRLLQTKHGRYEVKDVYFATPHVTSGCLFPVSVLTVDGQLKITFNPVSPIVSEDTNAKFADSFVELLETISGDATMEHKEEKGAVSLFPEHFLSMVTAILGAVAVSSHAGAWADFYSSVMEMKANVADPADFWAALNFWIFFAVGHPILQPILWISDVLHGSPGPMIAGLVPATFLAGNLVVIAAIALSKEIRNAVNIAALAAFLTYVGAGLDGAAGLGDYNLALDDSYKGQIVKGCPAYDDVRQPSMDNFDLEKYQGLWYEQKFHDWTQFKEVYDTTLGIKLTDGGKGWLDDFAVKGPAPDAAKVSWDKSPVANGAHYFLFGRVDPSDRPGILREKGFGVEFPNYIVDVQKDATTGAYTEAIQFQCLERGGVRVFEGINFMSRNPTMTDAQMQAMHSRAEKAGMFPYGASPEQMHTVARRPVDAPEIDNNWQAMWRAIGFDKLLELLTEAIEDGGR